ncbi:MAG: hypothetical protein AUI50_02215 [Crenarchaeota archaeon 13_1_40CM_2_52_14]|nr:MAG: hypothetical protein AUI97_01435 [Crenarchaeota archaeon 13_1_40CM_3_52_17]OLD35420.1 MAG: hypothetical protein AUI50_02215 [Crenarchaeota archaeon 13_1_40CM_2_52_14]OLE69037.1 MAG: hypothetical protein AUF78_13090 [archaeon 13_1_20CM_2_51_12]
MSADSRAGNVARRSAFDNRTTVRRLHGIEYRMFENSDDIHDFINTEVRRELETDRASMVANPRQDDLINSLPKRKWKVEVVNLEEIQLNPVILNSSDVKTGQKFVERLRQRRIELRKALEVSEVAIWPIVLLREAHLLVDGYCRHSTLKEMSIPEAYGYVGRILDK